MSDLVKYIENIPAPVQPTIRFRALPRELKLKVVNAGKACNGDKVIVLEDGSAWRCVNPIARKANNE